jgi:hypothetical protein
MIRRVTAASLAAILGVGVSPILLAQVGRISGSASAEARGDATQYTVQLIDERTNQLVEFVQLNPDKTYAFPKVEPDRSYRVALFDVKENRIVCEERGIAIIAPNRLDRTVNISCRKPLALIILPTAAGLATVAAVVTQSGSQ